MAKWLNEIQNARKVGDQNEWTAHRAINTIVRIKFRWPVRAGRFIFVCVFTFVGFAALQLHANQ